MHTLRSGGLQINFIHILLKSSPPLRQSDKKIKKKKKEDGSDDTSTTPSSNKGTPSTSPKSGSARSSAKSSRRSKRQGSNVFSMFSKTQVAEFKEGFQLMDADKDGVIGKNDLRTTFDAIGKLTNEKELEEMLGEASGPINFTQLLTLFAKRMSATGANDEDDVIVASLRKFDVDGEINGNELRELLMSCGQRFTNKEVDDAYDQMDIDDKNMIDTAGLIQLLTGKEEEDEPEPPPAAAAAADDEDEED